MNLVPWGIFVFAVYFLNKNKSDSTSDTDTGTSTGSGGDTPSVNPPTLSIIDIVDDLPKHPTKTFPKRSLSQLKRFVIHHSAWIGGDAYDYANLHIDENDWPGIGYHIVVQPNGDVFQTNYLDTICWHVENNNTPSIGICLSGNYETQTVGSTQLNAAVKVMRQINSQLGKQLNIDKHKDFKATDCPGKNMPIQLITNLVNAA